MIEHILRTVQPAAFELLPESFRSIEAKAFLLAVGLQSSRFLQRRKLTASGCRGFWHLERRHVEEVLRFSNARFALVAAAEQLRYPILMMERDEVLGALEHNDVLGLAAARCLLCTSKEGLPGADEAGLAWGLYMRLWAPSGSPKAADWPELYFDAWARATGPLPSLPEPLDLGAGRLPMGGSTTIKGGHTVTRASRL